MTALLAVDKSVHQNSNWGFECNERIGGCVFAADPIGLIGLQGFTSFLGCHCPAGG